MFLYECIGLSKLINSFNDFIRNLTGNDENSVTWRMSHRQHEHNDSSPSRITSRGIQTVSRANGKLAVCFIYHRAPVVENQYWIRHRIADERATAWLNLDDNVTSSRRPPLADSEFFGSEKPTCLWHLTCAHDIYVSADGCFVRSCERHVNRVVPFRTPIKRFRVCWQ